MKPALLLAFMFCGLCVPSFCQKKGQARIDSLQTALSFSGEDTNKVKILSALSRQFSKTKPDSSAYFESQAMRLAKKINYSFWIAGNYLDKAYNYYHTGSLGEAIANADTALLLYDKILDTDKRADKRKILEDKNRAYSIKGYTHSDHGMFKESLDDYKAALSVSTELNDTSLIAGALHNSGLNHYHLGYYPEALRNFLAALKFNEKIGNTSWASYNLVGIGLVYQAQRNFPDALKNFFASIALQHKIGDSIGPSASYHNIADIYTEQSNYTEALKYYFIAMEINKKSDNTNWVGENLLGIGSVYLAQDLFEQALENYLASLKIKIEIGDKQGIANAYTKIGLVYLKQHKMQESRINLTKGLALAKEIGMLSAMDESAIYLSSLDSLEGNFSGALEYFKKHISYRDSMYNEENTKKLVQSGMEYEFDKRENSLKYEQQLTSEKLLKQMLLTKQQQQELVLRNQQLTLSQKEKELAHLAFLQEQAMKHEKENQLLLAEKETGFLEAASKQQLGLREKEIEIQKLIINKSRQQKIALISGLALLLIAFVLIFRSFRNQQKANKLLNETQQQLVQQEKLASLGALTAGIAHEIKNPLNFVMNFSELSRELMAEYKNSTSEEERAELLHDLEINLEKINHHGTRADSIVQGMLQHARTGNAEKQLSDINAICNEFMPLAYHGMRANVSGFQCELVKTLDASLPAVFVVQQDIGRVLLNLFNNAFYAVKGISKPVVELITRQVNGKIEIVVHDNGVGMTDAVRQKIFEPFYTTKPSGQGTGLGLSMSHDIVKAHGGEIFVESAPGEGTTFRILLPLERRG